MQEQRSEVVIPVSELSREDPLLSGLRITKVVCSRSVRMQAGEVYVNFSASVDEAHGLSIKQGRVAALRLGMEVDRLAYQRAVLGRIVPADSAEPLLREIIQDYVVAIRSEVAIAAPEAAGKSEKSDG